MKDQLHGPAKGFSHRPFQARGKRSWTITPPSPYTANTLAFDALVTKWEPGMPVGKHATISVELYVTGPIVVS